MTAAVIPCFNEDCAIGALVSKLRQYVDLIIVVDDGSTDETARAASRAGAIVLRHGQNRGKGAALQTGLSHSHSLGCQWAVTLDGDRQHDPANVPALLRRADQTGAFLIIGNRMGNTEGMPLLRQFVNRWMSTRLSKLAGFTLPDTQSGFRLIHLHAWSRLSLRAQHFEVESEMLMAFIAANYRVDFVSIRTLAASRKSRIRPIADTLRWLRWWRQMKRGGAQLLVTQPAQKRPMAVTATVTRN